MHYWRWWKKYYNSESYYQYQELELVQHHSEEVHRLSGAQLYIDVGLVR